MSDLETALPISVDDAGASEPADDTAAASDSSTDTGEKPAESKTEAKPEKTPEQREIDKLRRRLDNKTRQLYELRAQVPQNHQQQSRQEGDDETVTLTRAELERQIAEQAQKLAPSLSEQQAEIERRQGIVQSLSKEWGQEKFDALAADLDEAFGGLADRSGRPKPATDAIFHADDPKALIEYLADPDNAEEAERIGRMSAIQAGRAIGKLEDRLAAQKAKDKPRPSNAPAPIEAVKGGGVKVEKDPAQMTDAEFAAWRRTQIAQRNK